MQKLATDLALCLRARQPFVYLLSWEEERAERAVAQVCEQLARPLLRWTLVAGLHGDGVAHDPTTTAPLAALAAVAAHEGPAVFLFKDLHPHLGDPAVVRRLRELHARLPAQGQALLLLSPQAVVPPELEKDVVVLDLPLPGLKEVAVLLHQLLRGENIEIELDLFERYVKASLGLSEEEIKRAYARVLLRSGRFEEAQLRDLIEEKRQIIRRSQYLEFHALESSIEDVGGLDNLKAWLVSRNQAFTEKARKFGLPQPKGLFLLGVQGCGKSLTAKAVADLWKVPLLRLDAGALVLGAAEEGLRRTIAIAESMAPAILWVDEIEKAFAGADGGGRDAQAARIFGNFVTWLQEKTAPVFVVATANDVRNLPPELLRKGRFDEIFWVDLPNIHEREAIFEIHLRRRGREPSKFDCWALAEATEKFSGAEIEQAIVDALFAAFSKERDLRTMDLLKAVRDTVPLAVTMDQQIKALKEWARNRTRPATYDTRRVDFFESWEQVPDEAT
jgi:ATP-dependent 26S proteasome regulatory subunit